MSAELILQSPRARYLCGSVAVALDDRIWTPYFHAAYSQGSVSITRYVQALDAINPTAVSQMTDLTLLHCLCDTVGTARYWQPPDEYDNVLSLGQVTRALIPIAENIVNSTAMQRIFSLPALDNQAAVQWIDDDEVWSPPCLTGAGLRLQEWRTDTFADERRAQEYRPKMASGKWWSVPHLHGIVTTSRMLPYPGTSQMLLTEDELGWDKAVVWPVSPQKQPRIYVVNCPEDWVDLVNSYPLSVTAARAGDWNIATGVAEEWFIPDWQAVSGDYDAAYLTVLGYLATAGRVLPMKGGATVLGGWDPDSVWWLSDILRPAGQKTV